jgi:hypothetical protein
VNTDNDSKDEPARTELLIGRIAALLESARERVAPELASAGIPYTVIEIRPTLEPDGNGWSGNEVEVETNALTLRWRPTFPIETLANWFEEAEAVSSELASLFPNTLSLAGHFPSGRLGFASLYSGEDDENSMLATALIEPTENYILRLRSAAEPDMELARSIGAEILAVLSDGRGIARQSIAIAGLEPERDLLECNGTRLRELSALERGDISATRPRLGSTSRLGPFSNFILATHVLEVDTETEQPNTTSLLPTPRILVAFQLHGFDPAGPGSVTTKVLPEWWFNGLFSRPIAIKQISANPRSLSQTQFEDVCRTADLLKNYQLDHPDGHQAVALQRFAMGCNRPDAIEGVLDFVIALEALLLPYDAETRHGDLAYRFRVHGAHFLAENISEHREIFKTLNKLYSMRSRIVHGDKYPGREEATIAANEGRRLAASGLLKAVHFKFPTAAELTRMVLREDVDARMEAP